MLQATKETFKAEEVIPLRARRKAARGYDKKLYKERNLIERMLSSSILGELQQDMTILILRILALFSLLEFTCGLNKCRYNLAQQCLIKELNYSTNDVSAFVQ